MKPNFASVMEICGCSFCNGDIEFNVSAAGQIVPCPHCKKDIQLPTLEGMGIVSKSRNGTIYIRLHSGAELEIKSLRFYDETAVAALNKNKAEAFKLCGDVSTGLIPIGTLTTVIEASLAIGLVEGLLSGASASAGEKVLAEAIIMERKLRASGKWCAVGDIEHIDIPIPAFWRAPFTQSIDMDGHEGKTKARARIHNGDEFVIGMTEENTACSFRWTSVDHYIVAWND
jgi:hypothetical protein